MSKESVIEAAIIHARTRHRAGTQWLEDGRDFDIYYAMQYGLDVLKKDRAI